MAESRENALGIKPTLGLLGSSMNAMALIAPGAFLWATYQIQVNATTPAGASAAPDMWAGILLALVLAFLTAFSYAELAKLYPQAGFASCTYFAEQAFLDSRKEKRAMPHSMARYSKLATGWAAHLFYWVYPGVMVAFFATLVGYLYTAFTNNTLSNASLTFIGVVFAIGVGFIAYKGVSGSTMTNIWINVIQWVALVIFSALAIYYRMSNPEHATQWAFTNAYDVVKFHSIQGVLVQSTIAILILVGFESSTAMAPETKNPETTIPKAIIIALFVQGVLAYLFEYFAANLMVSEKLTGVATVAAPVAAALTGTAQAATAAVAAAPVMITQTVTGMAQMANSSAPIGDMCIALGNHVLPGIGFGLMIVMAITVGIAVIGTTLSCINTAVRVTNGMAEDRELPEFLAFLHAENKTPHTVIGVLVVVSCVIAAIGVQSVDGLTGITLASNFGTFVLYGLVCIWTYIAYKDRPDFSALKHLIVPFGGLCLNVLMCAGIFYLNMTGTADNKIEAQICFYIAGGWALLSFVYIMVTTVHKSYGLKMVQAIIRPDTLDELVETLTGEGLLQGMTVTDVKGFGRQRGAKVEGTNAEKIKFLPKVRVEMLVNEWDVPHVMEVMQRALNTGKYGDGKIFVFEAEEVMRVRTGETGSVAV